jgi:hypothetical protein
MLVLEKAFKDLETKKDWTKIMTKDDDGRVLLRYVKKGSLRATAAGDLYQLPT